MNKKTLAFILLSLVMCLSLTGCFKADTNVKLGWNGGITVGLTYQTTLDELKNNFGVDDYDTYMDEQIKSLNSEFEQGYFTGIDALEVEKAVEGDMYGVKMTISSDSFEKFAVSPYFPSFFQLCPITTSADADPETTVCVSTKQSPFGTAFHFNGNIDLAALVASFGFDAAELSEGTSTLTISSPLPFSTKTFSATTKTPAYVEYSAFIPNIAVLIMSLIILILAILLIIFAVKYSKVKKALEGPEVVIEYDEFGNPIIPEDAEEIEFSEDVDEYLEEGDEEVVETAEEATEEIEEIAEEVESEEASDEQE